MIKLSIPDMSCGHCVKTITGAITTEDAAANVQCDLGSHQITVETSLSESALRTLLTEAGYPPEA